MRQQKLAYYASFEMRDQSKNKSRSARWGSWGNGRILGASVRVLASKDVAKRTLESGAENEKALAVQGL
jgi:hypothetical protein